LGHGVWVNGGGENQNVISLLDEGKKWEGAIAGLYETGTLTLKFGQGMGERKASRGCVMSDKLLVGAPASLIE